LLLKSINGKVKKTKYVLYFSRKIIVSFDLLFLISDYQKRPRVDRWLRNNLQTGGMGILKI